MVSLQGVRLAVGWTAFVLALTTVNAMGLPAQTGVEITAAGAGTQDVQAINEDFNRAEVEAVGDNDPGFFGVATGVTKTIGQLQTILTKLSPALQSWGTPAPLAIFVQLLVDLSFGLALLQIVRGFRA
jgi:hypothetical protein